MKDGETATLIVSKPGYVSQTVTVAANDPSRLVKLAPVAPTNGGTKPGIKKPNGGGMSNDNDPWKTH